MILDSLSNIKRYTALHPLFHYAVEFVRNTDLLKLAPGCYPIVGEHLFAIVEDVAGRSRAEARLECHRRYIDIQLILDGTDEMGWKPLGDCRQPGGEYIAEKDIIFFDDAPSVWIAVMPGEFCIFFPEDAHAPLVSSENIRKVILKISVTA